MEGHEACAYYSEKLNWMLDPFHAKGHVVIKYKIFYFL